MYQDKDELRRDVMAAIEESGILHRLRREPKPPVADVLQDEHSVTIYEPLLAVSPVNLDYNGGRLDMLVEGQRMTLRVTRGGTPLPGEPVDLFHVVQEAGHLTEERTDARGVVVFEINPEWKGLALSVGTADGQLSCLDYMRAHPLPPL